MIYKNVQGKNEKLDFTYIDDLVEGVILSSIKRMELTIHLILQMEKEDLYLNL